ncbi:WD40 repeat domain-containing protein [Mycobacteroides abscessus]|uniref:WD40 repeat domain-containing protein n=1 Tax=Mycobacteroides abscessus TaxID=36809 RepID=UPI002104776D|nr:WD40 repeat domain-containing protein [Mycobacteroides abscessus]
MNEFSSRALPTPVGSYCYENLSDEEFQKLCQVVIAGKFDRVTCYPVGQRDGGRDITRKIADGQVVYQVKWTKNPAKNPVTWLANAVASESANIRAWVNAGATRYVLMTSVGGSAAAATGPNGYGAGTIDKLAARLDTYAEEFGLDSMECWWRDDIDALVSRLPGSVLWRFQKMLTGPEALRFLLAADREEAREAAESLRLASEARQIVAAEPAIALLVAWEALLRDQNELAELVFREALDLLPAVVEVIRPQDYAAYPNAISAGFVDAGTIFIANRRGEIKLGSIDNFYPTTIFIPGSGDLIVAARPTDGAVVTFRDGELCLRDSSGSILHHLLLYDVAHQRGSQRLGSRSGISFSDRGSCLVYEGDRGWIVSIPDGSHVMTVAHAFRFPPDTFKVVLDASGAFVVTIGDFVARVWTSDGSPVCELENGRTWEAYVLSDGTIVAGAVDGKGTTWDLTGARKAVFRVAEPGDMDLGILAVDSCQGYFATTPRTGSVVEVWSSTGAKLGSLRQPQYRGALSGDFSSDGTLLALGNSGRTVQAWHWNSADGAIALHGHRSDVYIVAFHPADPSILLSVDRLGKVLLWYLEIQPEYALPRHSREIVSLTTFRGWVFSEDGLAAAAWSPAAGSIVIGGAIRALCHAPDGKQSYALLVDKCGVGRLWRITNSSDPHCYAESPSHLKSSDRVFDKQVIAPDGQYVAHISEEKATLWSVCKGQAMDVRGPDPRHVDPGRKVVGAVFRPSGSQVAVAGENGAVWIWGLDGELQTTFVTDRGSPDATFDVAADPRGEFIATAVRNEVGLWNWEGNQIARLPAAGYKVYRVAISDDGERILTKSVYPDALELWDRDGQRLKLLDRVNSAVVGSFHFDPRCRYVVFTDSGGLSIVDWNGLYLARLAGPFMSGLLDSAYSPGGDLIAALFDDGITRIWSVQEHRRTKSLRMADAQRITFSADGDALLAGVRTGLIKRYVLAVEDLFQAGAHRVTQTLERDERERFGIDIPRLTADVLRQYRSN